MSQHLTSQQATTEIIALINTSPHSPRPDEIEAIIAKVVPQQPSMQRSSEAEKAGLWRRVVAEERAAWVKREQGWVASGKAMTNAELNAITEAACDKTRATIHAMWGDGASTWGDVVLFAEIAQWCNWGTEDSEVLEPDFHELLELTQQGSNLALDNQALAQLVNAVLQVGR
jgi:hypothetical protein